MTPAEINKAIAEACGWTELTHDAVLPEWVCGRRNSDAAVLEDIPNFSGSLDAMAKAWPLIQAHERLEYANALWNLIPEPKNRGMMQDGFLFATATAAQHAEAFLLAKGLWREPTPPPASSSHQPMPGS